MCPFIHVYIVRETYVCTYIYIHVYIYIDICMLIYTYMFLVYVCLFVRGYGITSIPRSPLPELVHALTLARLQLFLVSAVPRARGKARCKTFRTVDSKKLDHGCRLLYAGVPPFFGLRLEYGHVSAFWPLL